MKEENLNQQILVSIIVTPNILLRFQCVKVNIIMLLYILQQTLQLTCGFLYTAGCYSPCGSFIAIRHIHLFDFSHSEIQHAFIYFSGLRKKMFLFVEIKLTSLKKIGTLLNMQFCGSCVPTKSIKKKYLKNIKESTVNLNVSTGYI